MLASTKTIIYRGGWVPKKKAKHNRSVDVDVKLKYDRRFKDEEIIDSFLLYYLIEIIRLAERNNMGVILLSYPVREEYDSYMSKMNISIEWYHKTVLSNIYNEFQKNLTLLDYHDVFFDNPEYFYDTDHLNPNGSEVFSKRVYEDMKEMGLAS